MDWYTSEMLQARANHMGKPVYAWIPKPAPVIVAGEILWLVDWKGKVRDFKNPDPNFLETDPWEDQWSYRRLFLPE